MDCRRPRIAVLEELDVHNGDRIAIGTLRLESEAVALMVAGAPPFSVAPLFGA